MIQLALLSRLATGLLIPMVPANAQGVLTVAMTIAAWHGIAPPNDPARRMAADLAATINAFEAQRGRLRFEDEPSSFEAALAALKEGA